MGETNTNSADNQRQRVEPSVVVRIHNAIAARDGPDPSDCQPLYEVIDPDALEKLFAPAQTGTDRHGTVTFEYCEYQVTVNSDRTITVESLNPPSS